MVARNWGRGEGLTTKGLQEGLSGVMQQLCVDSGGGHIPMIVGQNTHLYIRVILHIKVHFLK